MEKNKTTVRQFIDSDQPHRAIELLDALIAQSPADDELFYLRGCAYVKLGQWQGAMQSFLEACAVNPNSPAAESLQLVQRILNFYNKDIYGQ